MIFGSRITGGTLTRIASSIFILVLLGVLAACGGDEETGKEKTGQGETTREAASAGSYPLPGRPAQTQGIAYQESTGDFFVGSAVNGAVFRGNVANEGEEAEVFLEPGSDGRESATGMKVDKEGRLFIAGGGTGRIFVYEVGSGAIVGAFDTPESENTFINDVTIAPDGDVYFTDPERPAIFRAPVTSDGGVGEPEEWLIPEEPPVEDRGYNIGSLAATGDGRFLIGVQSNVGDLLRIDLESKEVLKIYLGGEFLLTSGAGLDLDGQTLYVVRSREDTIVPVELSEDFLTGEVGESFTNPSFRYPTTIAKADDRLLVADFLEPTILSLEIPR